MVDLIKLEDEETVPGYRVWEVSTFQVSLMELVDKVTELGLDYESIQLEAGGFPLYLTLDIRP